MTSALYLHRRAGRMLLFLCAFLFTALSVRASGNAGEKRDLSAIDRLAVEADSRLKPFYVYATESMQAITGRATYKEETPKRTANEMVLELALHPHAWVDKPLILINYKPLKETLGLPPGQKLFSLKTLVENEKLAELAGEVAALKGAENPKLDRQQTEVDAVVNRISMVQQLMGGTALHAFPPPAEIDWITVSQVSQYYPGEKGAAAKAAWDEMAQAFLKGDDAVFSAAALKLADAARALNPEAYPSVGLLKLETQYAQFHPFRWAWVAYALAAIILGLTSLRGRATGYRLAWALVLIGFILQIAGFSARVIIAGRAPVTGMYETVVWMAFGTILFAIIMEAIYRSRAIFLAAAPVAVVALILADTQTTILQSPIRPLEAVLRDNFWLSTHVTIIVLAYAAFALALGVAHIILFRVLFGRDVSAGLYNYLYRSLQIGVLLLAIGIILGGVWANVSWGRFWDWDPKETWALIALLGYLALLHGRIAGWWKGFGLTIGAVLAFQSVIMAWYGVNFVLGEGLHSYGFGTGGLPAMMTFVGIEVAFVILAVLRKPKPRNSAAKSIEVAAVE